MRNASMLYAIVSTFHKEDNFHKEEQEEIFWEKAYTKSENDYERLEQAISYLNALGYKLYTE